ncbi:thiol-disulfide oxidoreductase DCC family protein [Caulobacter sp. FWC2]|uniref:thiol-disulfide oxidoreductase DCC family protein n=1 Tax=Caulobacter sp. FWC2 TaxID=69664 RepID=UPI000C150D49|nr:thiol-disulfide oxidoreductase DCC family protein [Caulobacter sp. FWC2]PIB90206.1 thiol-disulfide oxidoreductase [Caulobacter sp. FWC2]
MNEDGLMLFDGVCALCNGTVRTVLRLDREGAIRFTPIQSPLGRVLAARHGLDPDSPESFLFLDHGRALTKTAAIAALLRRLRAPWRWLAVVDHLPRGPADAAYDWIARNCYRLIGRRDRCMVPTPEQRGRFVLNLEDSA